MKCLGPSLKHLSDFCGGQVSATTALAVGLQLTQRISDIHKYRVIHQDIKPHNFTIGLGDMTNVINIIDFGLAKFYKDRERDHIIQSCTEEVIGTPRYMSLNSHKLLQ